MNNEYIIETKGLKKAYDGGQEVLSGLDLRVPRGSVSRVSLIPKPSVPSEVSRPASQGASWSG